MIPQRGRRKCRRGDRRVQGFPGAAAPVAGSHKNIVQGRHDGFSGSGPGPARAAGLPPPRRLAAKPRIGETSPGPLHTQRPADRAQISPADEGPRRDRPRCRTAARRRPSPASCTRPGPSRARESGRPGRATDEPPSRALAVVAARRRRGALDAPRLRKHSFIFVGAPPTVAAAACATLSRRGAAHVPGGRHVARQPCAPAPAVVTHGAVARTSSTRARALEQTRFRPASAALSGRPGRGAPRAHSASDDATTNLGGTRRSGPDRGCDGV